MDPQTHLIPFNALKGTYFDTLPEELLIEICMYIKTDSILYDLSDYTKKAYLKYLDWLKMGYINNFKVLPNKFYEIILNNKERLITYSGFLDIVQVDKIFYRSESFYDTAVYSFVYQSTVGNYFYVEIRNSGYINVKVKNNWKDLWSSLDSVIKESILIRNGYTKWVYEEDMLY